MKRFIFLLIITVTFSGCQKVFKEDKLNQLPMNSPEDLKFALSGLYYRFASIASADNNGTIGYIFADADDVALTGSQIVPREEDLLLIYKPIYQTIASANDILKKSEKLNKSDPVIRHLLGEAYFMRAYSYFWLVRVFGQVPLIDNVDVTYSVKKSSFQEIYNLIITDLQKAISLLPNSNNEARIKYVTPHRGTAKALLAEVYLTGAGYPLKDTRMYASAAKLAGEVIDSADYFGYGLMTDLANLWNGKHEVNQESLFSIYSSGAKLAWFDPIYNTNNNDGNYLKTDLYFTSPRIFWIRNPVAGIQFYHSFPNSYRKDKTYQDRMFYRIYPPCLPDSLNPGSWYCPSAQTLMYDPNTLNPMYLKKYYTNLNQPDTIIYDNISDQFFLNYGNVIYLFRYAHTLLTYAEAKARSGNIDASAYEAVNQVRRRANKVDLFAPSVYDLKQGLTPEQFADSVVWERAWEFCAEPEGRWFDLLRLDMIKNLKNLKDSGQLLFPVYINMDTYFWPLPKTDKMLDPNLQ
jgi:starch-binding outer membrane protein, SusD/RagB family